MEIFFICFIIKWFYSNASFCAHNHRLNQCFTILFSPHFFLMFQKFYHPSIPRREAVLSTSGIIRLNDIVSYCITYKCTGKKLASIFMHRLYTKTRPLQLWRRRGDFDCRTATTIGNSSAWTRSYCRIDFV